MTHQLEHQIIFTLDAAEIGSDKPGVWAVVRKPDSEAGATPIYPYAVWIAENLESLNSPDLRQTKNSSVESLKSAIRMFFTGRASFVLDSGLPFTLDELTGCENDDAILELIQSRS